MKAQERHRLKQNEFAIQVARATEALGTYRTQILGGIVAVVAIVVLAGVWSWWSGRTEAKANAQLATAMQIYDAPIVPAPTVPGATQQAGTYPTEQARSEAALTAFQQVIDQYGGTDAAVAARYHHAASLVTVGKYTEAMQGYEAAMNAADDALVKATAKLGLAEAAVAAGQFDRGITLLQELAADRDGILPIDGILMQLAGAYQRAGKPADARTAFKRVVDEFPDSLYVPQARTELVKLG
jgi:hypothetical protein